MRAILSVDDFIKLAAGVILGLFALYIAYVFVVNYTSAECWRKTTSPFDDVFLNTKSMQSGLGGQKIIITPDLKDCLKEISFADNRFVCTDACKRSGLSSSTVAGCEQDCTKQCSNGCIMLTSSRGFAGNALHGELGYNKPRVYGSGDYKFNFRWTKLGDGYVTITPKSAVKCIIFTKLADGKTYEVTPTMNAGDCK